MSITENKNFLGAFIIALGLIIYYRKAKGLNTILDGEYIDIEDFKTASNDSKNNSNESLVNSPNDWDNSSLSYGIE